MEPPTRVIERALWDDISSQMIFSDSPRVRLPKYTRQATFARGKPYTSDLMILRGIDLPDTHGAIKVTISVKNIDPAQRTVTDVFVTDTLPDGFIYRSDSAKIDKGTLTVTGSNPYQFGIGKLDPNDEVRLTYCAVPYKK